MFPSSRPTWRPPATSQSEAQRWHGGNYPAQQEQNTPYQYISSPVAQNEQDIDNLFEDDEEEPTSYEEASNKYSEAMNEYYGEEPNEDFAPSGWTNNDRSVNPAQDDQTSHYRQPPSHHNPHTSWLNPTSGQAVQHRHDSMAHSDPDLDFGFQQLEQYMQSNQSQPRSHQQSLKPDPPYSGYSRSSAATYPTYSGASDINRPRIASSNAKDPYSDVEEEQDDDEQSDSYGNNEPQAGFQQAYYEDEERKNHAAATTSTSHHDTDPYDEEAEEDVLDEDDDEQYKDNHHKSHDKPHDDPSRNGPSPTESQLLEEGFEFHNELLEHLQIERFNDKAFRKALREVRPELPRKQQWYAWLKVAKMLQEDERDEEETEGEADAEDGHSPTYPQRDFPGASTQAEVNAGCQCVGDSSRCTCQLGECRCAGCPKNYDVVRQGDVEEPVNRGRHTQVEDEQDDTPMDIGMTPITPRLPNVYDKHGIQRIPGLGDVSEEAEGESGINKQKHRCKCGDDCCCPEGECQCPPLHESNNPEEYRQNRLSDNPLGWLIKKAADSQPSSPLKPVDPSTLTSTFNAPSPHRPTRPPYIPQQNFSIVRSATSSISALSSPAPMSRSISRPDTPRPLDTDVRQSVEPEMPLPNWHRESTPAYTDRSPSPSPTSLSVQHELDRIDGISDVGMRDITPTANLPAARAYHRTRSREGSVAPREDAGVGWKVGRMGGAIGMGMGLGRTSGPATTVMGSPSRLHPIPAARNVRVNADAQGYRGEGRVQLVRELAAEANVNPDYFLSTSSSQRLTSEHGNRAEGSLMPTIPAPPPVPVSPETPSASVGGGALKLGKQRAGVPGGGAGKRKSGVGVATAAAAGVQSGKIEKGKQRVKSRVVTAKQVPRKGTGKAAKVAKGLQQEGGGDGVMGNEEMEDVDVDTDTDMEMGRDTDEERDGEEGGNGGKGARAEKKKGKGKDGKGKSGKVKGAVARIEERLVQKDGTPPRRSLRIRGKGERVSYGEML